MRLAGGVFLSNGCRRPLLACVRPLRGDSEMVQRLATEMYARGLSTRDIEDAFTDEQGRCLLSRSKVSEVTRYGVGVFYNRRDPGLAQAQGLRLFLHVLARLGRGHRLLLVLGPNCYLDRSGDRKERFLLSFNLSKA